MRCHGQHLSDTTEAGKGVLGPCDVWPATRVSHAQRSMPSVAQAAGRVRLLSEPPIEAKEGTSPGAAAGKNLKHA